MIRVIIKRQVKEARSMVELLRQLRIAALPQPGYVSGETLINTEDKNIITVISTWRTLEDWQKWEASEQRERIIRQVETLLAAPSLTETYEISSTE